MLTGGVGLSGKVWKFGNNVNTDIIIPARYLNIFDPAELAKHCMEDTDNADFKQTLAGECIEGDVIIAGDNFGCGSSREHAPIAIKAAGIKYVIASGFARIFYRNGFNIGLPLLECPEAVHDIEQGNEVEVDMAAGRIRNATRNQVYQAQPIPEFMQELIEAGGLMARTKKRYIDTV